jgi:hypothetical protein
MSMKAQNLSAGICPADKSAPKEYLAISGDNFYFHSWEVYLAASDCRLDMLVNILLWHRKALLKNFLTQMSILHKLKKL